MRFLVIDDDFEVRHLVCRLLEPYGDVDVAADGEEGVEAFVKAHKARQPYDLITLDILMPHADGQQTLREIRAIEREREVPLDQQVKVVVISGLEDTPQVHDAFFLGSAIGYIAKPIHKDVFLHRIGELGVVLKNKN